MREIHARGHEIGSHSYWHRLVYGQSGGEFRDDLRCSRSVLEDAIGAPVTAYRAPSFSITRQSLWALEMLVEEGFRVDSSVFPVRHDRYGIPGARHDIHRIATPAGPLWEFPLAVVRLARLAVPMSGGGYFRLYPLWLTLSLLRRIHRAENRPFMFYIHPWEVDCGRPRLHAGPMASRFRHYVNLSTTERKLDLLLAKFRFGRVADVIGQVESSPAASFHACFGVR